MSNQANAMLKGRAGAPAGTTTLQAIAANLSRWRYLLLALVALAQAAVLVYMVADRETLLANGRTIDLKVIPVDPRDLFRGDYVTLTYDISRVPLSLVNEELRRGDQVYVQISQQDDGWKPVMVRRRLEDVPALAGGVTLAARVRYAPRRVTSSASDTIGLTYGIEKFFVPEGAGRDIERQVRAQEVVAHVAVGADGTAALKALTVDGRRYDLPPLF